MSIMDSLDEPREPRPLHCASAVAGSSVVAVIRNSRVRLPGFTAFFDGEEYNREAGDRIGPPPAKGSIEADSEQGGDAENGTKHGFGGVGSDQRGCTWTAIAFELGSSTPLGNGQGGHDDEGRRGDGDS